MAHTYDDQNIFAKILRGEIPNSTVLETDHTLAFQDINPLAPVHVLVIPKGAYVSHDHFAAEASEAEIIDFMRATAEVCRMTELSLGVDGDGYRVISNCGADGVQDVPHYHLHVLGGRNLGRMVNTPD
ncbi:MAG: histidine triad nucleotide-binding protein [Pseudomonadota bacterium]